MSDFLINAIVSLVVSFLIVLLIKTIVKDQHEIGEICKLDELLLCASAGINKDFLDNDYSVAFITGVAPHTRQARLAYLADEFSAMGSPLCYARALEDLKTLKGSGHEEDMLTRVIELSSDGEICERDYIKLSSYANVLGLELDKYI